MAADDKNAPALLDGELVDDRSLEGLDADRFRHGDFVRELAGLVQHTRTPANIALFGSWGSGKSGIANLLGAELTDKKQVRFVVFEASKYAEAPLRRHFISQVAHGLGIKDKSYAQGRRVVAELLVGDDPEVGVEVGGLDEAPPDARVEDEDEAGSDGADERDGRLSRNDEGEERTSRADAVARHHAQQLVNYLRKTNLVNGPAPDLWTRGCWRGVWGFRCAGSTGGSAGWRPRGWWAGSAGTVRRRGRSSFSRRGAVALGLGPRRSPRVEVPRTHELGLAALVARIETTSPGLVVCTEREGRARQSDGAGCFSVVVAGGSGRRGLGWPDLVVETGRWRVALELELG